MPAQVAWWMWSKAITRRTPWPRKQAARPIYGVPGLETTLPLLLLAVRENRLSLERVIDLVAENPRRIWGLDCPPETFTTVDLDSSYVIERANLHTQCGWSPFEGLKVWGRITGVTIRGTLAYDGETVLASPGSGHNLYDIDDGQI
jgi:dihydroorotase-like cyclic amidohydrolase